MGGKGLWESGATCGGEIELFPNPTGAMVQNCIQSRGPQRFWLTGWPAQMGLGYSLGLEVSMSRFHLIAFPLVTTPWIGEGERKKRGGQVKTGGGAKIYFCLWCMLVILQVEQIQHGSSPPTMKTTRHTSKENTTNDFIEGA